MFEVDEKLESILICAERYACGRRTYMPGEVVDFITPLIPQISTQTLTILRNDITEAADYGDLGDPEIDAPLWKALRLRICTEMNRRIEASAKEE